MVENQVEADQKIRFWKCVWPAGEKGNREQGIVYHPGY